MLVRLTKTIVEAARPGPKEYCLWDVAQRGFGLRVRASGAKTYVFRYSGGRTGFTRRLTLGSAADITCDKARLKADKARGAVADRGDPAGILAAQKAVPTVKEFAQRYLSELAKSKESLFATAAIRLLVLTGARRGEILGAKWDDIDMARGVLRVENPKEGKAKEVRLGPPALKVLKSLPRISGNEFVICGKKRGHALVGLGHIWERIREKAGLEELRLHDLRHSYASVAVSSGASLPIIGALLGHASPEMTQRYAHLSADPLRTVADSTSERISSAMKGKAG